MNAEDLPNTWRVYNKKIHKFGPGRIELCYEEPLSDSVIIQVQNDADGLANSRSTFAAGNVVRHLLHLAPSPAHAS